MYHGFGNYTTVAQKQRKAEALIQKMRKGGQDVTPVAAFKGPMATTFWGKSWCENLEAYADFKNRLGRGRSYVRAGCVCHLEIHNGMVKALVSGSALYTVTVTIPPLQEHHWRTVCKACAGQVGSLLELLQGKLSKNVMEIVCHPVTGLFPSPKEIRLDCSCPDWANMCKHVTAALYGIGRRLDTAPELLFVLRGVNASDIVASTLDFSQTLQTQALHSDDLGALFGIDLDMNMEAQTTPEPPQTPSITQPAKNALKSGAKSPPKAKAPVKRPFNPDRPTAGAIRKLRTLANMDTAAFAHALGVSVVTLNKWCAAKGVLTLRSTSRESLVTFQDALWCLLQHTQKSKE